MRGVLLIGLAALAGCGKKDGGGPPPVEFEEPNPEAVSNAYRDNPAAADAKYKGKVGRLPVAADLERDGKETVVRFVHPAPVRSEKQPDVVFRFASEAEPAKMERGRLYHLEGRCEGLSGRVVTFTNCRVVPK